MNAEQKERIDRAWIETDYGKLCEFIANEERNKADDIQKKIFDEGYLTIEMLEDELAAKIAKIVENESDIDEYLRMLDEENNKLVEVLIHHELFYKVQNIIKNQL